VTGFSRQPHAIAAARRFLILVRHRQEFPTYGEVSAQYGGIARGAAQVLNSVRRDCAAAGEPDLSALVVDKATGLPGTFNGAPVLHGSANEQHWLTELHRIRSYPWKG